MAQDSFTTPERPPKRSEPPKIIRQQSYKSRISSYTARNLYSLLNIIESNTKKRKLEYAQFTQNKKMKL